MQAEEINPNLPNQPILVGQPISREPDVMLTKVNADIETKRHVFLHWCAFFILVSIFVISSVFMPESVIQADWSNICYNVSAIDQNQQALLLYSKFCLAADSEAIRPILIEHIGDVNQFLIVYGQFSFDQYFNFDLNYFNYTATLFGLKKREDEQELYQNLVADKFHSISINCEINDSDESEESDGNDESDETTTGDNSTSGNRILQPGSGQRPPQNHNPSQNQSSYRQSRVCETQVLLFNPDLDYHSYLFVLNFTEMYNLGYYYQEQGFFNQLDRIEVDYSVVTVNPSYSKSVLGVRYTFFAVSILLGIMFGCKMRALYRQNWVIEQRFVVVLSVLLPFFNDPLYAATLLHPNRVTSIIGVIFFSNFICLLLLYWLVLFHRIVLENGTKDSNALTKPKIIVCGLLWIFFVACYSILVMQYFRDPSATFDDLHHRAYLAFKVLSFTFALGIFIYLLKYLIMFCKRYETRLWRYKLIGLFNIFYMMCLALFILSGSFEIYNLTGTEVVICISILNLYIYYQQYLWAPSKQGLSQQNTFTTIEQQMGIISNEGYDELRPDDININQENVVDEKFQVDDDKEVAILN